MRFLALLLAACAAAPHRVAAPSTDPALEAAAAQAFAAVPFRGVAVEVVKDHHVILAKGFGDVAGPDAELAIGSLTKQFTAAAALRLVDAGKVALTDPVTKYVPAFTAPSTIADLLQQTSGIPDYAIGQNLGKTKDELVAAIAAAPGDGPGKKWEYSNANYFLLGRVIEAVTGHDYADAITELAKIAGLKSTHVCASIVGSVVDDGGQIVAGQTIEPGFYDAAGAICSTANDLVRWQDALFGGRVLQPASLAFMITPSKLSGRYGAGLMADDVAGHKHIWHNGAVPSGYESQLAWYPDDKLQIVVLADTMQKPPDIVMMSFETTLAMHALGLPIPGPELAGTYTIAGENLEFTAGAGGLMLFGKPLLFVGRTIFALAADPQKVYAFKVDHGQGIAVALFVNNAPLGEATRNPEP